MSSEKQLSKRMGNIMRELEWHPVRVENGVDPGTPDCNTIHGWFEYKYVKDWPKRGGTLRIPHFTPQQRVWLRTRWRAHSVEGVEGHGAWMVLQVDDEVMVFDGETASQVVGNSSRRQLYEHALGKWEGFPKPEEFYKAVLL